MRVRLRGPPPNLFLIFVHQEGRGAVVKASKKASCLVTAAAWPFYGSLRPALKPVIHTRLTLIPKCVQYVKKSNQGKLNFSSSKFLKFCNDYTWNTVYSSVFLFLLVFLDSFTRYLIDIPSVSFDKE